MGDQGTGLARIGDAGAIAQLIQKAILTEAVRVKVLQQTSDLQVFLESSRLPDRQLAQVVYATFVGLGSPAIRSLRVSGQQGQDVVWTQQFTLENGSQAAAVETLSRSKPPDQRRVSKQSSSLHPVNFLSRHPKIVLLLLPIMITSLLAGIGWSYLSQSLGEVDPETASTGIALPPDSVSFNSPEPLTPNSPTASTIAANLPNPKATEPIISIKAVGDIVPGTNFPSDRLPEGDGQFLFADVQRFLGDTDILFGNFESTMTDYPYVAKDISQGMTFAFRSPPTFANVLKETGFDVMSVANNHSFDFSDQGFADTVNNIEQVGIKAIGQKGQISYLKVKGETIAFIGFSYLPDHNFMGDLEAAKALVDQAKQQAKIIVISVHQGAEGSDAIHTYNQSESFLGEDRGNSVQFARTMIDQGASLVLGHGPHVLRSLELYKSRLIAYSLGNFIGYRTLSSDGVLANSMILQVEMNSEGRFVSGKIIPVILDANGVPYIDNKFTSVSMVRNLVESDFSVTPILIEEDGEIVINEAK
ncbi:MAG: CapA family protein [Timaviella obliquedivisa GSE-PSE-MK23-08B]|nr:CapA family protein [Timaviella obliquedivisa GSE-PSE-MK23-08B]